MRKVVIVVLILSLVLVGCTTPDWDSSCQTTYIEDECGDNTGLNTDAIGMVIDFTQIQNRQDCKVNAYYAFRCEMGDRSYLCWTVSPEISCVIEYSADVNDEADIFRMAQSVQLPE